MIRTEKSEIPEKKNTIYISHTISTSRDISAAFNFIINNMSTDYSKLAKGHDYFRIINGNKLEPGSIIECSESAGNQSIIHKYVVDEIQTDKRISYSSVPSYVKVKLPWTTIDSKSNTFVYYDFFKDSGADTQIRLTIGIQFASLFEKIFSQMTGGIIPWKKHCFEEMEGLKNILVNSV